MSIYLFSILAWSITTVEINSGVCLLHQMPLFTSGGVDLGLVSSSLDFGLGLVILSLSWS